MPELKAKANCRNVFGPFTCAHSHTHTVLLLCVRVCAVNGIGFSVSPSHPVVCDWFFQIHSSSSTSYGSTKASKPSKTKNVVYLVL